MITVTRKKKKPQQSRCNKQGRSLFYFWMHFSSFSKGESKWQIWGMGDFISSLFINRYYVSILSGPISMKMPDNYLLDEPSPVSLHARGAALRRHIWLRSRKNILRGYIRCNYFIVTYCSFCQLFLLLVSHSYHSMSFLYYPRFSLSP